MKFKYVDLFSGCGGLSLGLESMGGQLVTAVERSPMAAETFFHNFIQRIDDREVWANHLKAPLSEQLKSGLIVDELRAVLDDQIAKNNLVDLQPDVVVGGPPCQGFSLAGRRNPEDVRNILPWQFLEVVEITKPKIVVIENVVGMRHKFNKEDAGLTVFDQLQLALKETAPGYVVQAVEVNALHYGAPQHRPRLMIIGLRSDLASKLGVETTGNLWKSNFLDLLDSPLPALAPKPTVVSNQVRTVGQALSDLIVNQGAKKHTELSESYESDWGVLKNLEGAKIPNHIERRHTATSITRFRIYQWMAQHDIDSRLISRAAEAESSFRKKIIEEGITKGRYPAMSPDGHLLGETRQEMVDLILSSLTRKHSQRVLAWDKPARTVVTIGDDYVHPFEPRTFTVRELARFQGFPNSFEFKSKETTGGVNRRNEVPQYSQVGNAVSPFLAKEVGKLIRDLLEGE